MSAPVMPIPADWNTTPDATPDGHPWDYDRAMFGVNLADAAFDIAFHLCLLWGWENGTIESDGRMIPCPSQEDMARALQVPIPPALILHELAVCIGCELSPIMQRAFDELRSVYFPE